MKKSALFICLFASSLAAQVQIGKNVQIGGSAGGGSGCVPATSPLGKIQINGAGGTCVSAPADYGVTTANVWNFTPGVRFNNGSPNTNFFTLGVNTPPVDPATLNGPGDLAYPGQQVYFTQNYLPTDNPSNTIATGGPFSIGFDQDWMAGWDYGAPGNLSDNGWWVPYAIFDNVYSTSAGIHTNLNLVGQYSGPGDLNFVDWIVHSRNARIAGADQGQSILQIINQEDAEYEGHIKAGIVTAITLGSGGTGYVVGDTGNIIQSGAGGANFIVNAVGGSGNATSISFYGTGGKGYSVASGLATSGPAGTGLTVNVTAITSGGGTGATILQLTDPIFNVQSLGIGSPLIDLNTQTTCNITAVTTISVNGGLGNLAQATTSCTLPQSNTGNLVANVDVPRTSANSTFVLSHGVRTFQVAMTTPPTANSTVCNLLGSAFNDTFVPTAVTGSSGLYNLTATLYFSHDGGYISTLTGSGGTGYIANELVSVAGGNGGSVRILTVTGGVPATYAIAIPGNGYTVSSGHATTSVTGSGTGFVANITATSGARIDCGGAVGSYVEQTNYTTNGSLRYLVQLYASPGANTALLGNQVPNSFDANYVHVGPAQMYQGAEVVGVINDTTGQADGSQAHVMGNNAPWAAGHDLLNTNNISAAYTDIYDQTSFSNPFAQRNGILYGWGGRGGGQQPSTAYSIVTNTNGCGNYIGCGGIDIAPGAYLLDGLYSSGLYMQYAPLASGPVETTGCIGGSILCVGNNNPFSPVIGLIYTPNGKLVQTAADVWDFSGDDNLGGVVARNFRISRGNYLGSELDYPFTYDAFGSTNSTGNISADGVLALGSVITTGSTAIQFATMGTNHTPECVLNVAGGVLNFVNGSVSCSLAVNGAAMPSAYPGTGIPNSTGSAWGTSYSTTGTGTTLALGTSPAFVTPTLGNATATQLTVAASLGASPNFVVGGSLLSGQNASSVQTVSLDSTSGRILGSFFIPGVIYSAAGTPLPTCGSAIRGQQQAVSDATSPTYMGAYASGGSILAAVVCSYNGTTYSWLTH